MQVSNRTPATLWNRLTLRGRLLLILLSAVFVMLLLSMASLLWFYRAAVQTSDERTRATGEEISSATEDLFYQQGLSMNVAFVSIQAGYLDARLEELERAGETVDWDALLQEAVTYLAEYIGAAATFTEGVYLYIHDGTQVLASFNAAGRTDGIEKSQAMHERIKAEYLADTGESYGQQDFWEVTSNIAYNKAAQALLAAAVIDGGTKVLSFFEETDSPGMTAGAFRGFVSDSGDEAAKVIAEQLRLYLLILIGVTALLAAVLIPVSRKLAAIVVTPVEREQQRQEIAIARANQEQEALRQLDRLKTEFLGNISHELKTPLTVVSGYAQTSQTQLSGEENEAVRNKMRIIASEADRLALMVGQILDVARMEEGRMGIEKQPCHMDELLYSAVETHFPMLNQGGNRLEIHCDVDLPQVAADPSRVTQVLVNLIANAARHTADGLITLSAQQQGPWLEVCVADTGSGIPPAQLPKLFDRFQTGDVDTGTGLGLTICKHIVEQHGGDITAESTVGEGTKIRFTLPLDV